MTMVLAAGSRILVAVVLMIVGLSLSANAATYTVGGTTGWTLGISATFYDDWAKQFTFAPGDTLGMYPPPLPRSSREMVSG